MMDWVMNGLERIWKEVIMASLKHDTRISLEGLSRTMKILSQDIWCPGWDFNQVLPEYESEVLLSEPAWLVARFLLGEIWNKKDGKGLSSFLHKLSCF
jgi:hypothetical protein